MRKVTILTTVSALALLLASPLIAQDRLVGTTALNDRIDNITDDVNEDLARGDDAARFGENGVEQGFRGSIALQASGASGNTDTGDLSGAGRLTYGVGDWSHSAGFAVEYGETNGVKSEEKFFGTYEASRYFTPSFYAFGIGRYEYDGFATNKVDAFLGFGPGYRLINTSDMTWRVQAGPGVRYVKDQTDATSTETGFIVASRFYKGLTDTLSLTNDTDVLGSSVNTIATNDFGLNYKLTNNLSTRVSYRTEYNSDPLPGLKSTDNSLGLSLVIGF
jgi:putative salt-induced outer membrane protein